MSLTLRTLWTALALSFMLGFAPELRAQSVADFYRGKTLHVLIGYGEGGGYDIYGRLLAEFLPRYLPGSPTIIPQNMPGAGSFKAVNYLYEVAPKDGTYFGSVAQTLAVDAVTDEKNRIDPACTGVCTAMPSSSFHGCSHWASPVSTSSEAIPDSCHTISCRVPPALTMSRGP